MLAALLPGPYTFVVATSVPRPDLVGTPDSLGVRIPDHPDLLRLLAAVGMPAGRDERQPHRPSRRGRRRAGRPRWCSPIARWRSCRRPARRAVAGVASTVVDLRPLAHGEEPVVLREGAVSRDEVMRRIRACRVMRLWYSWLCFFGGGGYTH